eukprot:CAMPEP_0184435314 /NCGR_PEP_ID=MMETSP0738-20130409/484611_1 /TAXON_ID=385413 /ORGANISM="Thalassiosira miniscula, Strain CCMP1093" /LENGTH=37 /DNA_ID= /DNA_START= /DNA_END= /DNA_ORIENTATION=
MIPVEGECARLPLNPSVVVLASDGLEGLGDGAALAGF